MTFSTALHTQHRILSAITICHRTIRVFTRPSLILMIKDRCNAMGFNLQDSIGWGTSDHTQVLVYSICLRLAIN